MLSRSTAAAYDLLGSCESRYGTVDHHGYDDPDPKALSSMDIACEVHRHVEAGAALQ